MRKLAVLVALLAGCSSTPQPVILAQPTVYHPSLPTPYKACKVVWEVNEVEAQAKVSLSYNDNITMAICFEDLERFLSQSKTIICYYRQKLKEDFCKNDTN